MAAHDVRFEHDHSIGVGLAEKVSPRISLARDREVVLFALTKIRLDRPRIRSVQLHTFIIIDSVGSKSLSPDQIPEVWTRVLTGLGSNQHFCARTFGPDTNHRLESARTASASFLLISSVVLGGAINELLGATTSGGQENKRGVVRL
jgi:hypothetical protein